MPTAFALISFQWKSSHVCFGLWISYRQVCEFFFCIRLSLHHKHIHYPAVSCVRALHSLCIAAIDSLLNISFFFFFSYYSAYGRIVLEIQEAVNAYVRINDNKRRAANQIQTLLFTLLYIQHSTGISTFNSKIDEIPNAKTFWTLALALHKY